MKTKTPSLRLAPLGSVSSGTLRTPDLLNSFSDTLQGLVLVNGDFFCLPENRRARDNLARLIGEVSDCLDDSGSAVSVGKEEEAAWLLENLINSLNMFAPAFSFFGAHECDVAGFGFWPSIDSAKEGCEFVSSRLAEFPDDGFEGEWLHVSDRGNFTLYVRTDGADEEAWSIV